MILIGKKIVVVVVVVVVVVPDLCVLEQQQQQQQHEWNGAIIIIVKVFLNDNFRLFSFLDRKLFDIDNDFYIQKIMMMNFVCLFGCWKMKKMKK